MSTTPHFGPELFGFLRELADHNEREWFDANKERYEEALREPAIQFIMDFGDRLKRLSPHFRADPRKQGGSLFRIYRDMRFDPDGPPFKTHTGIQFRHAEAKDVHAPGFYLHLEPGNVFVGAGIWHPGGPALKKIRNAIVDDPEGWRAAVGHEAFSANYELAGDSLKLGPRGFDRDHPLIDDLKRKDFIGVSEWTEDAAVRPDFIDRFEDRCRAATSLVEWLCGAVGVRF